MKIVFFGTSSFAARILERLLEKGLSVVAIVTRPDRFKGRHLQPSFPPVKETAQRIAPSIPLFQPEKASSPEFAPLLQPFHADLFIVVAYGEIIKKNLLEMPTLGCINIHASLLPKYRGAAPIQRCLMAGEKETGITIIEMTPQMDAGDILAIEALPIPDEMNFSELDDQLCALAGKLLFEVIDQIKEGKVVKISQDPTQVTFAPKILPEDEQLHWTLSAQALHNQIRALAPFPGAWCQIKIGSELKRLKIKKAKIVEGAPATPGSLLSFSKDGWIVACGDGALRLIEVQMEGKKAMAAEECIRGIHQPISMLT